MRAATSFASPPVPTASTRSSAARGATGSWAALDEIYGGRGDDAVYDGGGKDLARTGKGADIAYVEVDYSPRNHPFSTENRIYLGPGIDEISARNGHRDGLLSCGRGGDDEAILDSNDPKPRSCEILQRGREAP